MDNQTILLRCQLDKPHQTNRRKSQCYSESGQETNPTLYRWVLFISKHYYNLLFHSSGDPTIFGNLSPSGSITEALVRSVKSNKYNGYLPSNGLESAREAVARYVSVTGADIHAKVSRDVTPVHYKSIEEKKHSCFSCKTLWVHLVLWCHCSFASCISSSHHHNTRHFRNSFECVWQERTGNHEGAWSSNIRISCSNNILSWKNSNKMLSWKNSNKMLNFDRMFSWRVEPLMP